MLGIPKQFDLKVNRTDINLASCGSRHCPIAGSFRRQFMADCSVQREGARVVVVCEAGKWRLSGKRPLRFIRAFDRMQDVNPSRFLAISI